jgi:hypothetical protein
MRRAATRSPGRATKHFEHEHERVAWAQLREWWETGETRGAGLTVAASGRLSKASRESVQSNADASRDVTKEATRTPRRAKTGESARGND